MYSKLGLRASIFFALLVASMVFAPRTALAVTWDVYPGPGTPLQTAINGAGSYDTIVVHAGTYLEALYIDKPLTLTADGTVTIQGAASFTTNYNGAAYTREAVIFVVNATNVVIEGFTIEGSGLGPSYNGVIEYIYSGGRVSYCTIDSNTVGNMLSLGIEARGSGSMPFNVDHCTIQDFGRIGAYFVGCTGGIYYNEIIGQTYSLVGQVNYGIEIEDHQGACNVEIMYNNIYGSDNTYQPEPTWSSAGIIIDINKYYFPTSAPSAVWMKCNNIHDNYFGIELLSNPKIHAYHNNITGSRVYGALVDSDSYGVFEDFDAIQNWWGDTTGPYHSSNPTGMGDEVSDHVIFEPYLYDVARCERIDGPIMWVSPNAIVKEGPCLVSSTFQVEVKLWNKMDLTGVGVYGFDFTVGWDNSIPAGEACPAQDVPWFTLMEVEFTSPWDHYYVIVDELSEDGTSYHLAITALDGSDALEEVQIVLATLTFHIDCEPLWPDAWTSAITLTATLTDMVDGKPVAVVPNEIDSGTVTLSVAQPDVYIAPEEICEYKVGMTHTIEFYISNINKVYGFGFGIVFPNTVLEGDVQSVVVCDAFPPPYEYLNYRIIDNGDGTSIIVAEIARPCEKPTVTHQEGPAATFTLTSIYTIDHMIPLCDDYEITLEFAYVLSKCGCEGDGETVVYGYNYIYTDFELDVTDLAPIDYYWRPRVGDLNLDGAVDITDLDLLAAEYGEDYGLGGWGNLDEINTIVDIYDFVVLAKYYGKPFTCMIEDAVCWPDP